MLAHGAGFDHHFVKPVELAALRAAIDAEITLSPLAGTAGHHRSVQADEPEVEDYAKN
ncbi:hypothetical protein [Massilia sp. Se16.2.3]|uniref:hypothetical protein n=1 Tax=Massilia sp. Se16.2.3 TaxID=2709303 RepID=UPI001603FFDD|nr:hypothetical protein [Massilia sp. Se16.2.3]QNB00050.1 hypothetical protein G4G31_16525 [Massilia sp. Se16.2.3]